tara:strand:- start:1807 stop:2205 length:399 start_codon:yes stop_codon:yes gene_type:complete
MFKQFAATQILANAIASVLDSGKDLNCENVVSTMMVEASKNEIPDADLKVFSVHTIVVATNTPTTTIVANLEEIAQADDPLMCLARFRLNEEILKVLQESLEAEPDEDEEEGSLIDVVRRLRGNVRTEKEVN